MSGEGRAQRDNVRSRDVRCARCIAPEAIRRRVSLLLGKAFEVGRVHNMFVDLPGMVIGVFHGPSAMVLPLKCAPKRFPSVRKP